MKAEFELKIYNDVELKSKVCLAGVIGREIVHLVVENETTKSKLVIELSASELIIAASRLAGGPDGQVNFPDSK